MYTEKTLEGQPICGLHKNSQFLALVKPNKDAFYYNSFHDFNFVVQFYRLSSDLATVHELWFISLNKGGDVMHG